MADWVSVVVATVALVVALGTWYRSFRMSSYDAADAVLTDLMKLSIEHPEFRDPDYIRRALDDSDPIVRYRYDAFAALVWNYLESLYNRFGARGLVKSPFFGAFTALGQRHRAWVHRDDNFNKYPLELLKLLRAER